MAKDLLMDDKRIVRVACDEDLPEIIALLHHLNPDDPPLDPVRARAIWSDMLQGTGVRVFVVEDGGVLLATCTLILVPNLTRGGRPYAFIENVVTHAEY